MLGNSRKSLAGRLVFSLRVGPTLPRSIRPTCGNGPGLESGSYERVAGQRPDLHEFNLGVWDAEYFPALRAPREFARPQEAQSRPAGLLGENEAARGPRIDPYHTNPESRTTSPFDGSQKVNPALCSNDCRPLALLGDDKEGEALSLVLRRTRQCRDPSARRKRPLMDIHDRALRGYS